MHDYFDPRFDEALASVGLPRAVDVKKYAKHLAPIEDDFTLSSEKGEYLDFVAPPPQYKFCVLLGPFLNAVAFRFGGAYYVGITLELALRCHIFAYHLFANKRFYAAIGDPSLELDFVPLPKFEPMNFTVARAAAQLRPKCEVRREAAWFLGSQMMSFILCHEKAHVLRGHVDLVIAGGRGGITEGVADIGKLVGTSQELRIAQEFDADRFAALTILRVSYSEMRKWPHYSKLNLQKEHTKFAALSAYCAIGLLEPWDGSHWLKSLQGGYPPQAIRRMNVVYSTVIGRFAGTGAKLEDAKEEVARTLNEINAEGETIFWVARALQGEGVCATADGTMPDETEVHKVFMDCFQLWGKHSNAHKGYSFIDLSAH